MLVIESNPSCRVCSTPNTLSVSSFVVGGSSRGLGPSHAAHAT